LPFHVLFIAVSQLKPLIVN